MRFKANSQSGQALIIAVSILVLLLLMSQFFATLVIRNLNIALAGADRGAALDLAQAGVEYALDQLRGKAGSDNAFAYEWKYNDTAKTTVRFRDGGKFDVEIINPYCPEKARYDTASRGAIDPTTVEFDRYRGFCLYSPPTAQVTTWADTHTYAKGDIIRPLSPIIGGYLFECIDAGTSGTTEPPFNSAVGIGATLTDNNVIWRFRPNSHPHYVKIIATGSPADVPDISKTVEVVAEISAASDHFLRLIGSDCTGSRALTSELGFFGSMDNNIVQPAPIYVQGDVEWGGGVELHLDNTNILDRNGNLAAIMRQHSSQCVFQATGNILSGAPYVRTAFSSLFPPANLRDSLCYFSGADLPYYMHGSKLVRGYGTMRWYNGEATPTASDDFSRYAKLVEDIIADESSGNTLFPTIEALDIDNPDDNDDNVSEWTAGTGADWLSRATLNANGVAASMSLYSPHAAQIIFHGATMSVRYPFSNSGLADQENVPIPDIIYAAGNLRIGGRIGRPVTIVSDRNIFIDKPLDALPQAGSTLEYFPALVARRNVIVNTTQLFYYYATVASGKAEGNYDSLTGPAPAADHWPLTATGDALTIDLSSLPPSTTSRMVMRLSAGSGALVTVQEKRSDGHTFTIFSTSSGVALPTYFEVSGSLMNTSSITIRLENDDFDNDGTPAGCNIYDVQLMAMPPQAMIDARMLAYSGSFYILHAPAATLADYDNYTRSLWGRVRPADLLSVNGSVAERILEPYTDWSALWPADSASARYVRHNYDLDLRDWDSTAAVPPFMPRMIRVVSWVTR